MEIILNNEKPVELVRLVDMEHGKVYEYCLEDDTDSSVKNGSLVMRITNSYNYFISLNQLDKGINYWSHPGRVFKPRPDIKSITLQVG